MGHHRPAAGGDERPQGNVPGRFRGEGRVHAEMIGSRRPRSQRGSLRQRRGSAPAGSGATPHRLAEQRAGDHEPLDLARALVDLGDLGVAVVALGRELLRVAVAAEDLDRLAGLAARDARTRTAWPARPRRCAGGRPPSAARRATSARAPPRSRSACRRASAGSRRAGRSGRRTRCAPWRTPVARSSAACAMPTAWAAIPIRPPSSVRSATRMPLPGSPSRSPGVSSNARSAVEDEFSPIFSSSRVTAKPSAPARTRNALTALVLAGEDDERRGVGAVGDPLLGAGDPAVDRPRAHRARVGAGARLGQRERGELLARGQRAARSARSARACRG